MDGEGRVYSAGYPTASTNYLTSTIYNTASQPTAVNFASGDSDSFTYDPNSDRMTKYTFSVNSQLVVGTLTWNSIGTLETLAITDAFNSTNAQTCNYQHDDLSRIATDNCGSVWSQTFSYDPFGNIGKSGTQSFQPTYSSSTNHMTSIGSNTPTYDANGNVTNDFLNSYAWDSNGRPVTVDGVGVTYDALGRMVEQNKSGVYTEIAYSPTGFKMELLNGSTQTKAFVPLPGGTSEVWTTTANYYRHSDWLSSSRLASTTARTVYYDGAYGPFGEQYANSGTTDLSFTGMNQDTASNVYDFPAREYGIQGRWPSPDPAGRAAAHKKDPQTWNRYAYVRNSPLEASDPTGLFCVWDDGSYDATDDPTSGTPDSCVNGNPDGTGGGGVWYDGSPSDYGLNSDWSASPNNVMAFVNAVVEAFNAYPNEQFTVGFNSDGTWTVQEGLNSTTFDPTGNPLTWYLGMHSSGINQMVGAMALPYLVPPAAVCAATQGCAAGAIIGTLVGGELAQPFLGEDSPPHVEQYLNVPPAGGVPGINYNSPPGIQGPPAPPPPPPPPQ